MHAHTLAMAASSLVGRQAGLAQDADVVEGLWAVLAGWPGHEAVFSLSFCAEMGSEQTCACVH